MANNETTAKIISDAVAAITQGHQADMGKIEKENQELKEFNSKLVLEKEELVKERDALKKQLAQKREREESQQKKIDFIAKAATIDPDELNSAKVAEWFGEEVASVEIGAHASDITSSTLVENPGTDNNVNNGEVDGANATGLVHGREGRSSGRREQPRFPSDGLNTNDPPEGDEGVAPPFKRGRPSVSWAADVKHGFDRYSDDQTKSVCLCTREYKHLNKHIKKMEGEFHRCRFCKHPFSSTTLGPHEESCTKRRRSRRN